MIPAKKVLIVIVLYQERGDYLNEAAKLLSDDERNTYQTAAEVIDSERMLEKSSAVRKKNQLAKRKYIFDII